MATERQIAANRKNARKSTGPKTAEGKARSSMNALKHGLTTPFGLLPGESEEEYAYHREELLDELYPDTSIEHYLADRIVYLSWTLKRAAHFIRVTLHDLLGRTCGDPLPDDNHPDIYLARMVVKDFANNHVIERLEIYERRIENSLYKTMREYEKQKKQSAHTESPVGWDESHQSTLDCLPSPAPETAPATENPFLKERTQFHDAKTPHNANSNKDLHQRPQPGVSREQTHFHPDSHPPLRRGCPHTQTPDPLQLDFLPIPSLTPAHVSTYRKPTPFPPRIFSCISAHF